jgi:hypothetical protein
MQLIGLDSSALIAIEKGPWQGLDEIDAVR